MKKRRAKHPKVIVSLIVLSIAFLTFLYVKNLTNNLSYFPIVGFDVLDLNQTETNQTSNQANNQTENNQTSNVNSYLCPGMITNSLTLTSDLNETNSTACIILNDNSLTLDCNNYIISAGSPAIAIQSSNNLIKNCIIKTPNTALEARSNSNIIKNFLITDTGNQNTAVNVSGSSNTFANFTFSDSQSTAFHVINSNSNIVKDSLMDNLKFGIILEGSSGNNMIDNVNIQNTENGVVFYNLQKTNNSIINSKINGNTALKNENSFNNYITDSDISSATTNLAMPSAERKITLINSTYDPNKLSITDNNKALVYKQLLISVVNSTNSPLNNVKININYNNKTEKSLITDSSGKSLTQLLSKTISASTTSTPTYNVELTLSGINNLTTMTADSYEKTFVFEIKYPKATEFAFSGTTDLTKAEDLKNVSEFTLYNLKVKIIWDRKVNAYNQDFDNSINFDEGIASINTTALDATFNSSATIHFYNVTCASDLVPVYYEGFSTSRNQLLNMSNPCNSTSSPSCTSVSCQNNRFSFAASHFSSFSYKTGNSETAGAGTGANASESEAQPAQEQQTTQQATQQVQQQATPETQKQINITNVEGEKDRKILYYILPVIFAILIAGIYFMKKRQDEKPPELKIS